MAGLQNKILSHDEIQHKIKRIAWQIYETFANEEEILLAGIAPEGLKFANKIRDVLEQICTIKITICEVHINKKDPLQEVSTSLPKDYYTNKCIVLADDVLNSGSTLIYSVKHFLNVPVKKFKTAVLVDRNHKRYPVKADFKGISLSTSLQEHVNVVFGENQDAVYLE